MFKWRRTPDPKKELESLVGSYELPSFSTVAMSTLTLLREDADMKDVAEKLMTDPGLTVRLLKTVNSAAFGMRKEVTNLQYATTLLGRARVESLVLTAAVGGSLPAPDGIDMQDFWRVSARRACLAKRLAAKKHPETAVESFTAGLLQNMAIPVLVEAHGERYVSLYQASSGSNGTSLHHTELEAFGYDHAQIGAMMAEVWGLPEGLITAIADHHHPGQRAPDAVEAVAHVYHSDPAEGLEALRDHCQTALALRPDELDPIIEDASTESASLADSMLTAN